MHYLGRRFLVLAVVILATAAGPLPHALATPVTGADSYQVARNGTLTVSPPGVLANDSGATNAVGPTTPSHGTLTWDVGNDGGFSYTPDADVVGTDSFDYTAFDSGTSTSATGTVTITVGAVDDDGVRIAQNASDAPIDVLANDTDDPTAYTISITTPAANGTAVADNTDHDVTYTPTADYSGPDSFVYQVDDGSGGIATATVSLIVDTPPVANDDSASTTRNVAIASIPVLANDTDADGDPLTIGTFDGTSAQGGTVADNGDGTLSYTPAAEFSGTDTFTYTADDGYGGTSTATVTVDVSQDAAPVANDDSYTLDLNTASSAAFVPPVLANDTDANGDTLTATLATGPIRGVAILGSDGTGSYTPNSGFCNGTDAFTYTASDGTLTDAATVNLTVTKTRLATTLTATQSAFTIDYGKTVTITGHLTAHGPGAVLSIQRRPYPFTGAWIIVKAAEPGPLGNVSATVNLFKRNEFRVVQVGNCYAVHYSAIKYVAVRAQVTGKFTPPLPYGTSGIYHLFHVSPGKVCFTGTVVPLHDGFLLYFQFQQQLGGTWSNFGGQPGLVMTGVPSHVGICASGFGVGTPYRVHAIWKGDADHAAKNSAWLYFKLTP